MGRTTGIAYMPSIRGNLTEKESMLLRRALDPASSPTEAAKAMEAFANSLRKRGLNGYDFVPPDSPRSRAADPPKPEPPPKYEPKPPPPREETPPWWTRAKEPPPRVELDANWDEIKNTLAIIVALAWFAFMIVWGMWGRGSNWP